MIIVLLIIIYVVWKLKSKAAAPVGLIQDNDEFSTADDEDQRMLYKPPQEVDGDSQLIQSEEPDDTDVITLDDGDLRIEAETDNTPLHHSTKSSNPAIE